MARPPRPGAHDALLEAARLEFALRGLEHARVEDVTRRAGVSKGAFYLHFATKEEAFDEILQRFFGALEDQVRRRQEAEERLAREHPGARGAAAWAHQLEHECAFDTETLELLWRNRQIVAALYAAGGSHYPRLLAELRQRLCATVSARIREKQEGGLLRRDLDPELVGDTLVGTHESFARRMNELREKPDLAAWARGLLVLLYEGLLGGAARPAPAARPLAARAVPDPSRATRAVPVPSRATSARPRAGARGRPRR